MTNLLTQLKEKQDEFYKMFGDSGIKSALMNLKDWDPSAHKQGNYINQPQPFYPPMQAYHQPPPTVYPPVQQAQPILTLDEKKEIKKDLLETKVGSAPLSEPKKKKNTYHLMTEEMATDALKSYANFPKDLLKSVYTIDGSDYYVQFKNKKMPLRNGGDVLAVYNAFNKK